MGEKRIFAPYFPLANFTYEKNDSLYIALAFVSRLFVGAKWEANAITELKRLCFADRGKW